MDAPYVAKLCILKTQDVYRAPPPPPSAGINHVSIKAVSNNQIFKYLIAGTFDLNIWTWPHIFEYRNSSLFADFEDGRAHNYKIYLKIQYSKSVWFILWAPKQHAFALNSSF